MSFIKGMSLLLRSFGIVALACTGSQAKASSPAFLVNVSNTTPRLSEMLEVTTAPYGTNVIATTNSGIISVNPAPWSAMAFSPAGTLYGTTLTGGLAWIDPTTAAFSVFTNLHSTASTPGIEDLITGAGLALSTNGTAYVSDGSELYTANLANGLCSNVGTFSQAGAIVPPIVFALAQAPNGTMFGLFLSLYTVNLTNAQVTQIGAAYPFGGGDLPVYARSAAFGSDGNLYMVGWNGARTNSPKLYRVNTNDGIASALGNLPFGALGLTALSSTNTGAPAIVSPPTDQTVRAGDNVNFTVAASGTPVPEVQWYFGGAEDSNATNLTLMITNISPTNAGAYYVVLTNSNGAATSAVVTLTVTAPILASTGSTGDFTNSILGLTTNPPTETALLNSNVSFCNLSFDPQGQLFAMSEYSVVSGPSQISGSEAETITIIDALYAIDTLTWTTNFIGNFQSNGVSGQKVPIGMAFSPSGVLYAATGGSLYTVDRNTAQGSLVAAFPSGVAIGGIAFAPDGKLYGGETNLYIINPTNASVTNVGALSGVGASILADMKYGADGFLYFCDGGSDGNLYRLNPANALVSVAANFPSALSGLAFAPIPTVVLAEPTNEIVMNGEATTFSVAATGTEPLEYQWYFDGAEIRGGTNSALTVTNALSKNNGTYYVIVSNALGPVTSSIATLATYTPPVITQPPKPEAITTGQTIALKVAATGSSLEYQWALNGTNLPGQTASTLTIRDAQAYDAGDYSIMVSNPFLAMPASASATVAVIPPAPIISSPANNSATGASHLTVTGREPANGGAASIMYQLNGGAAQSAEVSSNGLTWSAALTLAPGTNLFLVWATNSSGASATIKAHYVLNLFIGVAGSYYGLFSDEISPASTNSGYFNLTLKSDRVFTGDILLDGGKTSFSGQFDTNGAVALVASPAPGRGFDLALQLDLSGVNPLTGTVSNTAQAWTASLTAIRSAFGGTAPATNFEGNYLLALNGPSNPAVAPPGSSYATARISADGGVTLNAAMSDGSTFTSTGSAISQDGDWPLYGSFYSGKGSVLAWVKFPMHSDSNHMTAGQALWFETAGTGSHYYTNGFSLLTNELSLIVNQYIAPPKGGAVLSAGDDTVQIFGGNLGTNLSDNVTISANNAVVVTGLNPDKLSITIDASAGTFSGSFVSPVNGASTALKGVLLPDDNAGFGYFLGANQGGGILIQP
jgi:hypothetical protein